MMKKRNYLLPMLALTALFTACKQDNKSTEATDTVEMENTIPAVDSTNKSEVELATVSGTFTIESPSTIGWTGSKAGSSHVGTLNIKEGSLELKDGQIVGGQMTIDMNSITSTDLKVEDGKEKLEGHLKSPDFFETDKYPTASFKVKSSMSVPGDDKSKLKVTGDLTIKDQTKEISFDAFVIASDNGSLITATTPSFEINRVDYGIKYNSGVINTVKDKIINDNVGLVINIRAKK